MDRANAPHTIIELADYCMSVTRDIMKGRDHPLTGGPDLDAAEAVLAIVTAVQCGRIPEPEGWTDLRARILEMYGNLTAGRQEI